MRSFFMFNGKSSRDFGLIIENLPDAVFPERRGEAYQIDGHNGTMFREDGTFENYEQTYNVWTRDFPAERDIYQLGKDIAKWLIGSSGYCRLEDTYDPSTFRLARFAGPTNFQAVLRKYGRVALVFNCQPERYLKSGEEAVTSDGTAFYLTNPTGFTASPKISVTGSGTVGIRVANWDTQGSEYIDIRLGMGSSSKTVVLDCAAYTAQVNGVDVDDGVTFSGSMSYPTFPKLGPHNYRIAVLTGETYTGTITKIEVVPRWWTL